MPLLQVEITVFRKVNGILSKRISLTASGKVNSDGSECHMAEGKARRVVIGSMEELARLLKSMPSNKALALGRLRKGLPDEVRVVTKDKLNDSSPADAIARSAEFLEFSKGQPAFMLLDHDRKGMTDEVRARLKERGGFWKAVLAAAPRLADAANVYRKSTSAGLYREDTGDKLAGSLNAHVYIAVQDGLDIKRALKALHDRLWLAGFGYFIVGAAGQLLDRSIIDASVFGPERLVFEGKPVLEPPLRQDAEKRRPQVWDGEVVDTIQAISDLSAAEQKQLEKLKATAACALQPDAEAKRAIWAKAYARQHGLTVEHATRIITDAVDHHTLAPEFELVFDDLGTCTVADVLAHPDGYVNATLADPLEGIDYGRCKAKVLRRRDGSLLIHSFAHGGIKYQLTDQGSGTDHETDDGDDKKKTKQVDALVLIASERKADNGPDNEGADWTDVGGEFEPLFHFEDEAYADIMIKGHRETSKVRSRWFKGWLSASASS
jgi:hypothetical protein